MKLITFTLLASLSFLFSDCKNSTNVEPAKDPTPHFSQVDIKFKTPQFQCLVDQWYNKKYRNEPIVFRVINDASAYVAFIPCSPTASLPQINFTTSSLLG